jgi:hypothetical protein
MKTRAFVLLLMALLVSSAAYAIPYGFYNITNNNIADAGIGEAQLSVDVTDAGNNQVLFTFLNAGPYASSICDVYFQDGPLLGIASITNATGVSFSQYASPGNLPGGNAVNFVTTEGFSADSDAPAQPNGVNPGESLGITFSLINESSFEDVIASINTGELRIGIHVQGFASGASESYVNTAPVPEPATMLLLGTGLLGLAGFRKKMQK